MPIEGKAGQVLRNPESIGAVIAFELKALARDWPRDSVLDAEAGHAMRPEVTRLCSGLGHGPCFLHLAIEKLAVVDGFPH